MNNDKRPSVVEQVTKARSANALMNKLAPVQMAFWSDHVRAVANELANCALFSCRDKRKPRDHYSNARLFSLRSDVVVTYTGEELRSHDQDVWLAIAHACREFPAGNLVLTITSSEICKINGWEPKQQYYTEIYKSIQRLGATKLTVYSKRLAKARACEQARRAGASMEVLNQLYEELENFDKLEKPPEDGEVSGVMLSMIGAKVEFDGGKDVIDDIPRGNLKWRIPLDQDMLSLFAKPFLTLMPRETRQKLSLGAKILQGYYMSHARPNDVLLSSLAKLLNLDPESPPGNQYRTVLERLQELVDHGVLTSFTPAKGRGDVTVHVVRAKWSADNDASSTDNDASSESKD